jgi:hypothetical protein
VKLILLLAVALFFPAILRADWQWTNDLAVAAVAKGGYEARFTFKNNGASSVAVEGVNFSCSCTAYSYDTAAVRPGKHGALVIHLKAEGNATPGRDLDLIVWGSASTTAQELTIHIPDAAESHRIKPAAP